MAITSIKPSFNAGELSPRLDVRSDLEKYDSGCQTLENFIIMPQGGVQRRGGTEHLGNASSHETRSRIFGFNFSTTTRFVIEAGNLKFRFWSNGVQVESSPGVPLEVDTPYGEAQLRDIQYIQINDVMYFVHPEHPVYKLTRVSDVSWTFQAVVWDWPPVLDENITTTTITPSATTGSGITLTASANVFDGNDVGGYWQIAHARSSAFTDGALSSNLTSSTLYVLGKWTFTSTGTWTATLTLQRSTDNGSSWESIRTWVGANDKNISAEGTEEKESLLRLVVTSYVSNTSARYLIEAVDSKVYGVVKITGYSSPTSVTADVINDLGGTSATRYWSEAAFSPRRGYPRSLALHQQRIYFGGTAYRPQSIWASKVDDFQNFFRSSDDDSGLFFTLSAQESNPINWLVSQSALLLGTAGGEWKIESSDSESNISPTSIRARQQSNFGSKYLRALIANEVILFLQRRGRKVRELVFSLERDGFVASDLTLLAEHITKGEILECAFQQQPDSIFWAVTGEGELIGMTYERQQGVIGWHRHKTNGVIESVATIYGDGTDDEVWLVVKRTIDGETKRYVERFRPDFRDTAEDEDKPNWWYLDCAKRFTFEEETDTITGLDHLEGKTVDILADGAAQPSRVVADGAITLQTPASVVLVGLPFTSLLKPMKLEAQSGGGSTRGKKKRVSKLIATVYKSLGGKFSTNGQDWDWIYYREFSDAMDDSPPAFTGDKEVWTGGGYGSNAEISIKQQQPFPLTILALTPTWEVSGE